MYKKVVYLTHGYNLPPIENCKWQVKRSRKWWRHVGGAENAGLENDGLENDGLENNGLEFAELEIWRNCRQATAASHKPAAGEVGAELVVVVDCAANVLKCLQHVSRW